MHLEEQLCIIHSFKCLYAPQEVQYDTVTQAAWDSVVPMVRLPDLVFPSCSAQSVSIEILGVCWERYIFDDLKFLCDYMLWIWMDLRIMVSKWLIFSILDHCLVSQKLYSTYFKNWTRQIHLWDTNAGPPSVFKQICRELQSDKSIVHELFILHALSNNSSWLYSRYDYHFK